MNLVEALKKRKMSAADLARKTGISATTIYHMTGKSWESKTGVKTDTLAKIAKVLNATVVVDETKPYYFDIVMRRRRRK